MHQSASLLTRTGSVRIEMPSPDATLMPGVLWGELEAFPTPAYWLFQTIGYRLEGRRPQYRLGRTLAEEVSACLLGGHGIPARIGLAAFHRLREAGVLERGGADRERIEALLLEPLETGKSQVRYRFAAQKARYLAMALPMLAAAPEAGSGRELRDWLLRLPGVGPKTASWIARNWLHADDVAILDVHILRVGKAVGIFPLEVSIERDYFRLEARFLQFAEALGVPASELDATIWLELAASPRLARRLDEHQRSSLSSRASLGGTNLQPC